MTGYVCRYAPYEILQAFGEDVRFITLGSKNIYEEPACLHSNLCSFAKRVFGEMNCESFLSLNCCDSLRRAADAMEKQGVKVMRVTLPHIITPASVDFFAREIIALISEAERFFGRPFDEERFLSLLENKEKEEDAPHIALIGARVPMSLKDALSAISPLKIKDLTCSDSKRSFDIKEYSSKEDLIGKYAAALLLRPPCMRMADTEKRKELITENTKGIIYHTVKFCDFYAPLQEDLGSLPQINIETEFDSEISGQIITRAEAFFENNFSGERYMEANKQGIYYLGIDSGSTSTAAVLTDKNGSIVKSAVVKTGAKALDAIKTAKAEVMSGINENDIIACAATGYGRKTAEDTLADITEISCHAKGVAHIMKKAVTVIDIGGQDSKIIVTDENGSVKDFAMNDKCAAGTGRFFELLADTLRLPLNDLAKRGTEAKEEITISSMCAVFAESEIISLIAENKDTDDIICAVNNAVAARICQMASRIGAKAPYVITGGVAKNAGLVKALERKLSAKMLVPDHPQLTGALGAALLLKEKLI